MNKKNLEMNNPTWIEKILELEKIHKRKAVKKLENEKDNSQ
jgi:hypothetical protein